MLVEGQQLQGQALVRSGPAGRPASPVGLPVQLQPAHLAECWMQYLQSTHTATYCLLTMLGHTKQGKDGKGMHGKAK